MSQTQKPIFTGPILSGVTKYIGLPIDRGPNGGSVGVHIGWKDTVSSATITFETTSFPFEDAPTEVAGAAYLWLDSGEVITGPGGTAIGCSQMNVENVRQRRGRLKIVAAADCDFEIHDGAA